VSNNIEETLKSTIRTISDFPIEGIMFRDISPILSEGKLLKEITIRFSEIIRENNWKPDLILGPESRGFIFGSLLAADLEIGFIPVRKPGKLPSSKIQIEYSLEYGSNTLEMHDDAISNGQKIIIVDDLLATGGTVEACVKLCEQLGGEVISNLFVIELEGLGAREKLDPIPCISLIRYPA
jgi:adenine phosphoribosyltransferase|tara:strand:+ start:1485 stop:2027 length:543 start_codon:yes stop_codon:yes gene_type:complete